METETETPGRAGKARFAAAYRGLVLVKICPQVGEVSLGGWTKNSVASAILLPKLNKAWAFRIVPAPSGDYSYVQYFPIPPEEFVPGGGEWTSRTAKTLFGASNEPALVINNKGEMYRPSNYDYPC